MARSNYKAGRIKTERQHGKLATGRQIMSVRQQAKVIAKRKKEMNIEEVFASVSNVQASGLNPPPARTVLTPRSAESCLKHGINPEILRIRDLESFYGRKNVFLC